MSIENCILYSPKRLKDTLGHLNPNLHAVDMAPAQRLAQDLDLKPLLGLALFEELCQQTESGALTSANLSLLDRAVAFVAWATLLRHIERLPQVDIAPAGLETSSPDAHHTSTGIIYFTQRTMMYYKRIFSEWLVANSADYPLLAATTCGNEAIYFDLPTSSANSPNS